jgi:hypothetical protein
MACITPARRAGRSPFNDPHRLIGTARRAGAGVEVGGDDVESKLPALLTPIGGKPELVIAVVQYYSATRKGISTILRNPVMVVFLSSLATLVAVGLATRLAQRNDVHLGGVPSFRAE